MSSFDRSMIGAPGVISSVAMGLIAAIGAAAVHRTSTIGNKKERLRRRFSIVGLTVGGLIGAPVLFQGVAWVLSSRGFFEQNNHLSGAAGVVSISLASWLFLVAWALAKLIGYFVCRSFKEPDKGKARRRAAVSLV